MIGFTFESVFLLLAGLSIFGLGFHIVNRHERDGGAMLLVGGVLWVSGLMLIFWTLVFVARVIR